MTEIRFGTDGWRGIIAAEVTFASVRLVARAIARRVRAEAVGAEPPLVLVGYDTRFLAGEFARAAAETMAAEGLRVSLASDFAPTPALSYAVIQRGAAGALVLTASHNPAVYSGVKFKAHYGGSASVAFTGGVEDEIRRLQEAGPEADLGPHAALETFDAREPWLDRLETLVDMPRLGRSGIRVVLDTMYGAGQGLLAARLRRAGCPVQELHAELNPGFGGLQPEPIPAHLGDLVQAVTTWAGPGPRVGFAFDGDADRLAPVDEAGAVVTPHQTLALLLRHLVRHRGARGPVVKAVNVGAMVEAEAQALGLPVLVTPVGFKHIAEVMRQHNALLGGEESGSFAIREHLPERDGGLVALLLLECLAVTGKSLGTLVREMEQEYGPHRYGRLDLHLTSLAARDAIVARLTAALPTRLLAQAVARAETLDGVKLIRADRSWVMLRASGTEPVLRIYAEASTEAAVQALLEWGRSLTEGEEGWRSGCPDSAAVAGL